MPTEFKNVSEITQQVMDIVKPNPKLKNVWIQGKVSGVRSTQNNTLNFTLTDNNEKIQCVIFNDRESLQENLPEAGNNVSIKGEIYANEKKSEYRFMVTDVKLPQNPLPDQSVSVSTLTNTLKDTLQAHPGEVQGEISEVFVAPAGFTIFKLKDVTADGQSDIIECALPPEIDPPFPLETGERVNVTGQFGIFEKASAYRIEIDKANKITQVTKPPGPGKTTRNKCKRCSLFFYSLKDGLCSTCFDANLTSEGIVVGAVERYFKRFKNLSTQREYPIQFGSKQGRSDVVLKDSKNRLYAIAECKHIEYDGTSGIEQLESYLNASGTTLGLFADDTAPNGWTFLKNLGKGKFTEITRSQFEALIVDQETPPLPEQPKQNPTPPPIPPNSAPRLWQYITGVLGIALCICLTVLIMQLDEKNRKILDITKTISQLKNENKILVSENQTLQEQITKKDMLIRDSPQIILQLRKQIAEKDKQIQENTSTVLKLRSENETITSKNDELRKQLTKNESDIVGLQKQIAEMQAIIDSYLIPKSPPVNLEPPQPKPVPSFLNINTASIEELDKLPGIGPSKAKSIIDYREKHGKFDSVEDITKIRGIADKTLENLRPFIRAE